MQKDISKNNLSCRITPSLVTPQGFYAGYSEGHKVAPLYSALKHCGMTNGARGFTLIELLVVILIIGILAAVAVPQYQKVTEKSKATQALSLLKSVIQAQEVYHIANGSYANNFDELALEIPWTDHTPCWGNPRDQKSNADWTIEIQNEENFTNTHICRTSGKYAGAGFEWVFETISGAPKQQILCFERTAGAKLLFNSKLSAGDYCVKLFNGMQTNGGSGRYYLLP